MMFELAIEYRATETVTAHSNRELALAELLKFLGDTGCDYRVVHATWLHSSYHIFGPTRSGDRIRVDVPAGRVVIAELCRCEHTHERHGESGCSAERFIDDQVVGCGCRQYEPLPGDPTLFDVDAPDELAASPGQRLAESA